MPMSSISLETRSPTVNLANMNLSNRDHGERRGGKTPVNDREGGGGRGYRVCSSDNVPRTHV